MRKQTLRAALVVGVCTMAVEMGASASSHREAPFITELPKVDNTDVYMFRSYESGRADYVTLIANYQPFQDPFGGPNYFSLDPNALYEIHVDNTGDAVEDITFQFQVENMLNADLGGATVPGVGIIPNGGVGLQIGEGDQQKLVSIPFIQANVIPTGANTPITAENQNAFRNVRESYTMNMVRGERRAPREAANVTHAGGPMAAANDARRFVKPLDFIGTKTFGKAAGQDAIANYAKYARAHVYDVQFPGCTGPAAAGRVFVGQRQEQFAVNVGAIFDLVNANADQLTHPQGGVGSNTNNQLRDKSVTSFAVEVHRDCLQPNSAEKVVGAWATASMRQARIINPNATYDRPAREGGAWTQVSRLGMPLVNEVVIGIKDKDRFNSSQPKDDAQFADYVTHPTLPKVLELLFGSATVAAPTNIPRRDLVTAFLTGVPSVNQFTQGTPAVAEMLRLNVRDFGAPRAGTGSWTCSDANAQCRLGAALCFKRGAGPDDAKMLAPDNAGCDPHGFPNGRRPGDDVVDIELRVAIGYLAGSTGGTVAATADLPLGDYIAQELPAYKVDGAPAFPYLSDPQPGAK